MPKNSKNSKKVVKRIRAIGQFYESSQKSNPLIGEGGKEFSTKQVHNRNQGKKKLAKMRAKRRIGPSKKILEAAARLRRKFSSPSSQQR